MTLVHPDKYFAFGGNIARSLSRVLVAVLIARLAGESAFGIHVILIACETVIASIIMSLIAAPMMTLVPARTGIARDALVRWAATGARRMSLLAALLATAGTPLAVNAGVPLLAYLGFCVSLATWGACLSTRGWRQAGFNSARAFWADASGLSLPIVAVAIAAVLDAPVMTWFWCGNALGGLVALRVLGWPRRTNHDADAIALLSEARTMGRHMTIGTLANTLCARIQPLVLAFVGGATLVATYGASATLVGPLRLLSMTMSGVLRPRFAWHHGRGRPDELRRLTTITIGGFLVVGLPSIAVSALLGDTVGMLVFGSDLGNLSMVLPWAGAFAMLEAIGATLVVLAQTTMRRGAAIVTTIRTLTSLIALVVLWPACSNFGAIGAFAAAAALELVFVGALAERIVREGATDSPTQVATAC
jgi:O-antigen/teichoic acid export membrane protein